MQRSKIFGAAFAVSTLMALSMGSSTSAAQPADGDYVLRAVRSSNPKDVFVRVVKEPKSERLLAEQSTKQHPTAAPAERVRYRVGPPSSNPKDYFRSVIAVRD